MSEIIDVKEDVSEKKIQKRKGISYVILQERFVSTTDSRVEWSDLIFLPFHPVFKKFVLFSVLIKAMIGPIQSVYPIVYCYDVMDHYPALMFIKMCYFYFCDSIYGIDTFLHIVHRQVVDKAMRREHLPKSAFLLLCDMISLIPFFRLVETNGCPAARLWPNILAFNEFVIVYRIMQYFSLMTTHSYGNLVIGYTILMVVCTNCLACFWLLLTEHGFCALCRGEENYFDWRAYVLHKLNETDESYSTYVYGASFVLSFAINTTFDATKPSAILEFIIMCIFMVAGYIFLNFYVISKTFAESVLRLRKSCIKYSVVQKIIEETKRRRPSSDASQQIERYYKILWRKRTGATREPLYFLRLPRYLRLEIKQDLLWQLYHHSPILRHSSSPFRRWLAESIIIDYKLPDEKFYTGSQSNGSLFYLKSGILQLISADDGTTPILSVTGGTILGDINFLVPHIKRKVEVRCVTYCEIYCVNRRDMIRALHKFRDDRKSIMDFAHERIEHAKTLFFKKKLIRGLDRNEDEGVSWIRRRWWEIFDCVSNYNHGTGRTASRCPLPREETLYHCAKYIGQLVLCTRTQLRVKSMFTNLAFPWILNPLSNFGYAWHRIVSVTVLLVLCLYPPNLVKPVIPEWFIFFTYCSDTIYAIDIAISLCTAVRKQDTDISTFAAVLFERFKSFEFMLDLLSTIWIEKFAEVCGAPELYYTFQFNRLIKVFRLFYGIYLAWDIRDDPMLAVCRKIALINFAYTFITSHFVYELISYFPTLTMSYFYGDELCSKNSTNNCQSVNSLTGVVISWSFEDTFAEFVPRNLTDIYMSILVGYLSYLVHIFSKGRFISYLYLKLSDVAKYHYFVSCLKNYYQYHRIHQDLLKRLDRYLISHWTYYKGVDVLYPNTLEDEPVQVYWKTQGEVAEKIIKESGPFNFADPALIRKLVCAGNFLMLPRSTIISHFGQQCKNVIWVVQGYVKSEYFNEDGELISVYSGPGSMLSVSGVFFGKPSLRCFTAYTDCEVVYIGINVFFNILKLYPHEYSYLETCVNEFGPNFDEIFKKYILKHKDFQYKLRDRIYSTRISVVPTSRLAGDVSEGRSLPFEGFFWGEPETRFMQSWMLFRAITVFISIASASLLGGVGAVSRWIFMMISAFCDCIALIDIVIKLFLYYYDKRGILITNKRKCLLNYLGKGFILDIIGALPWFDVLQMVLSADMSIDDCLLINTVCKFAHIYIVFGYFNYICDMPIVNSTFVMIVKWQIVNILIVLAASHYLMVNCVHFVFNSQMDLIAVEHRNECWMPEFIRLPFNLSGDELHLIFAQSINLAQSGLMRMNFGRFAVDRRDIGVGSVLFLLGITFWFISCYTLTLLLLNVRGDTLFQHGVKQLERFLAEERVDKTIIENVMKHFRYCWIRTKGINIHQLTNERIGAVFQQDLSFYFYKKTFTILDSLLKGGDIIQRQLASACTVGYFLPGHDIFREMDLVTTVCIVHRGRVNIIKDGKKMIVLTKGDIFGQLVGSKPRPVRVTATADTHVDLLYIDIPVFQSIITDEIRQTIARHQQTKNDFFATKNIFTENPYDTVKYLLRGCKTILPPWSKEPTEARHGTWYAVWLYVAWLINPSISTTFSLMFIMLTVGSVLWTRFYCVLCITDVVHLAHIVLEFYTINLRVVDGKCVNHRVGLSKFECWRFYMDVTTLVVPLITLVTNDFRYQLVRMLRLKWFFDFEEVFCRSVKNRATPVILKLVIMFLLLHSFTCGWIYFACTDDKFPIPVKDIRHMNETIDFSQWLHPDDRKGGCARVTRDIPDDYGGTGPAFVVPKYWPHDYVIAMTYILLLHTHTSIDIIIAMSLKQVYYKIIVTYFMYLLDMWIMAVGINVVYTKYRELYHFDYHVKYLIKYLSDCGICKSLKDAVEEYTKLLWTTQGGHHLLPELAFEAPACLRHDLFAALYLHHLEGPPSFRQLPLYFKRQLCARFERMVVFPGKCIVREGDVFSTTYFIHEGEIEKWYHDESGENQLLSVLYTNGYFGCIAGLFVNMKFQFSYITRTVVDLVYLNLNNWEDLLDSYPDIRAILHETTREIKKEYARHKFGKS